MGREGALAEELDASPPPGVLEALSDEELRALTATIRAARRRQSAAVKAAGDQALSNLPWLVREPVKRIIAAVG